MIDNNQHKKYAGAIYHVTSAENSRQLVLDHDEDRFYSSKLVNTRVSVSRQLAEVKKTLECSLESAAPQFPTRPLEPEYQSLCHRHD